MPKTKKRFSIDARTVLSLGRDSIKDHVTAVVELVKNGYDAGATVVEIELAVSKDALLERFIRIVDNGHGMNEADVESKWLRIGFSEKLTSKTIGTRRRLGEKGVGRLSADRLGSRLQLRSQAKHEPAIGIEVDWSKFETSGRDLHTIEIALLDRTDFLVPQPIETPKGKGQRQSQPRPMKSGSRTTGCELLITDLRQTWQIEDIQRLREELSHLINPFSNAGDFQVRVVNDLDESLSGLINASAVAEGEIEGLFIFKGNTVTIRQQTAEEKHQKLRPHLEKMNLVSFCNLTPKEESSQVEIGDVEVHLRLYSVNKEALDSSHVKKTILTFLEANAGVRVYRDGVRVLPYGDTKRPEGDWLGLGKRKAGGRAAISRKDWKIEPNRIVGAVSIGRDTNPKLLDAASREGLISNGAFRTLHTLVLSSVQHLERKYHSYRKKKDIKDPVGNGLQPQRVVRAFNAQIQELGSTLKNLEKSLPKPESEKVAQIRKEIVSQERKFDQLRQGLAAYLDQALTFRGLATLGIAHASFGHEIQISAGQFIGTVRAAQSVLRRPPVDIQKLQGELNKAVDHGQRISTWGSYTLTRVSAAKRIPSDGIDIKAALQELVNDLQPFFSASSISLECGKMDEVTTSLVLMDLESLAINFLTNAYDFVKDSAKIPRIVRVDLQTATKGGISGFSIGVADSGKGVPEHMREDIWSPLFTTKQDESERPYGTGLGLTIVDAIVKDLGGTREVGVDRTLGGALFSVWIPVVD